MQCSRMEVCLHTLELITSLWLPNISGNDEAEEQEEQAGARRCACTHNRSPATLLQVSEPNRKRIDRDDDDDEKEERNDAQHLFSS